MPDFGASSPFIFRKLEERDFQAVVTVENTCFDAHERATEARILDRLKAHLVMGVTLRSDKPTVVAVLQTTLMKTPTVTDGGMAHNEPDGTVAGVHSLAVMPEYRSQGIGSRLLLRYIELLPTEHPHVKRVALLAHSHIAPFYEKLNFENRGTSACQFGGERWMDLVYTLPEKS